MAYTAALNMGPIPDQYLDTEAESRTVRIYVTAKCSTVQEYAHFLKKNVSGFHMQRVSGIWKTERYGQVFLTLCSKEEAVRLLTLQCVTVGTEKVFFYEYGIYSVSLRVHWPHATVRSQFLSEFFSKFGKVVDVFREFMEIDKVQVFTGVRIVKMELSDTEKDKIPHIVKFGEKQSMLVTAPGRMPICLRCHAVGHVRAKCPDTGTVKATAVLPTADDMDNAHSLKRKQSDSLVSAKKGKTATVHEDDIPSQMDSAMALMDMPGEVASEEKIHGPTNVPTAVPSWAERMDRNDVDTSASDDDDDDMLSVSSVHDSDLEENRDQTVVVTVPERASTEIRAVQGTRDSTQKKTSWNVNVRVTRTSGDYPDVNIYMPSLNTFVEDRMNEGHEEAIVHKRLLQTVVKTKVWTNLHNYVIPPDVPYTNFTLTVTLSDLAKCAKK